ncbi:type II toxin-antitoxin system RelB/DinJ family antitoxin [Curtanaerobium respiraculi]|uniref:type II toxin-antitoxin system RelB/DinJ family antitoxin n=1 Tax=Curtanaerobium respiraculi TaxID=2949669 RepID=UPI0024B36DD6|nr:type II toxin-antitoxin system RelB/DinJ family antitoxin [Curtanaerobium respiraculi]
MSTIVQARVEDELKKEAVQVFENLGLDLSTAIRMFLKKAVATRSIPFEVSEARNVAPACSTKAAAAVAIADASSAFPAIERAWLFGSFATGSQNAQSDIDVRLDLDRESGSFTLNDVANFAKRVERLTGREVDVVTSRVIGNKNLAAAIEKEGVLVYEREA